MKYPPFCNARQRRKLRKRLAGLKYIGPAHAENIVEAELLDVVVCAHAAEMGVPRLALLDTRGMTAIQVRYVTPPVAPPPAPR